MLQFEHTNLGGDQMHLTNFTLYMDEYLAIHEISDYPDAFNGLQVQGNLEIQRVALAVDACSSTIQMAIDSDAQLLVVHHGLFWGQKAPITGSYYSRLNLLIKSGIALYSCHLPLDAHPEVGNNHVLARQLGLQITGGFGRHQEAFLGVEAQGELTRDELTNRISSTLSITPNVIPTGPKQLRRIGIITGGAGSYIEEAADAGLDTLLTGEGAHHHYFSAEERGVNLIFAGHYATETVGILALQKHIEDRLNLSTCFLSHPTGL